ncbi:hypothetical protein FHT80_005055 [Rhizobium sp. BK226]|nr:hypothetical protein [Rhizobium sp. BK226]
METPIRPLLGRLSFTSDRGGWGYRLRFGLFEIDNDDAELIAEAMLTEPRMHVARKQATVPVQCTLAL